VQKTRAAALGLQALNVKPDVLITSPYVRAAQTAEIFAETLGFPPQKIRAHEALKPAGNPADIVKEVIRLRAKEVMCFGHAPQLDLMIAHVTGAHGVFTALKKAGVACLEHTAGQGRWEILWILTPKMLRQLAD
jgi:phosphohistidine phosphatase